MELNITGLQKTQNAYKISDKINDKLFIDDYQAEILEKVLNDKHISSEEELDIKTIYNSQNKEITIPVVANDQTDFILKNNWDNLSNPLINKTRLVLRNGMLNIPNQAWMYDDGDWMRYNKIQKKDSENRGYIEIDSLSTSKFTYAPIFDQTGFNLINEQEYGDNIKLMDNSYGFYNLTSVIRENKEELNLEIRPYYSFDNIVMFIPNFYKSDFENLKQNGNVDSSKWWKDNIAEKDVPKVTKEAWKKVNPNITDEYFAIKPYSLYFDNSGKYERELRNLSGSPVQNITSGYDNYFSRSLRDNNGPITFGIVNMNWLQGNNIKSIKFNKIDSIGVYGSSIIIADQDIVNILSGYNISKYIPFNLQYEDLTKPIDNYTYNDVKINTYDYINPIEYYSRAENLTKNELVYGSNDFEKSIRPNIWYTGVLSNSEEPHFITTQASFSRSQKYGSDTLNGANYGASTLEIQSTKLLSQQKALINQLSVIILSMTTVAITLLIIIMILTVTLINDLYVNQYKKFMIVMKSLGYSNWKIINYTFGTVTILSFIFYILGVFTNFAVIAIGFNIISRQLGSIPFGLTWWTPIVAILLVFGAFFISIAITTRKIRSESPSVLMK
ncbi:ABC transporter permease [Spiroplasma floricola]|uniref:ABC transporter permease n=1 Tax=Spiroplasma floricola TaxID=216937 RepID=UPI000C2D622C|nr:ABC transporter permease [Spiroplasma floricola]